MKRPWIVLTVGALALVVLVGGTYAWLAARRAARSSGIERTPTAPATAGDLGAPIAVYLQTPADGDRLPANGTLPLSVLVDSQHGVQVVQFWLDGEWLTDVVPPAGQQRVDLDLPAALLTGDQPHTLIAVAVDQDGRSRPGNAVRLSALPAVEAEFILTTLGGESLGSIAQQFGQTAPRLLQANTPLLLAGVVQDEAQALPAGLHVRVPLGEPTLPEGTSLESERHPVSIAPDLPVPPSVAISTQGCDVAIQLTSVSSRAEGYRVYRLDADQNVFQPVGEVTGPGTENLVLLQDAATHGTPTYYITAYNSRGETSGPLTQVAFSDPGCLKPSGLSLSDGILRLPAEVERAYIYAAINAGEYNRWPRGQGEFLIPQEGAIDLHPLTDSVVGSGRDYPFEVSLEAWGWTAGELRFLGTASGRLERTRLEICNLDGACTGDMGSVHFVEQAAIGSDSEDQSRVFRWSSSLPNNPTALFQLSIQPFAPGAEMEPRGLVYSKVVAGSGSNDGSGGTFVVNFANLRQAVVQLTSPGAAAQVGPLDQIPLVVGDQGPVQPWLGLPLGWKEPNPSDLLAVEREAWALASGLADLPVVYYARLIPLDGNAPSGSASNSVRIDYRRLGPHPTVEVYNDLPPAAYEVSILGFNPPAPPWLHWGCVDIVAVDEASWVWKYGYWATMKDDFLQARDQGWAYCPTPWRGQGEPSWYEALWDFIQDGSSWLSQAYEDIKAGVVDLVASGLNEIPPGDLCGDSCKAWLKAGLDAGLAALGIPPSLPDVNKLTDEGIAYLVQEGARQIGAECGPECQQILTDALHDLKDQMLARQVSSYANADEAHAHGYNPLPLPPEGLTVTPSVGNTWQLAYATLHLTRTAEGAELSADELRKYQYDLRVGVQGRNEWMVGRSISVATAICYNDASMWPCDYKSDLVTEPLEGSLFGGSILVPDLAPGQSMDVQVVLIPNRWWYADHEKYSGNTWEWYDEWWHLYNHGRGSMTATISAQGIHLGGPETFVISQDGPWEFDLPLVDLQGMNAP